MRFHRLLIGSILLGIVGAGATVSTARAEAETFLSYPPLRPLPTASKRPMGEGEARFVDTAKGNDEAPGSEGAPWRTIQHALTQIEAGTTLYLRGRTYYERLYCSVTGAADKPVTIRSFPGELAVIDGGLREFFEAPATAWEPYAKGSPGEFRSTKVYRNLRNLHGRFGDSMIGLQIYYYIEDLRGERYVGPGLWYDRHTGRIHARLQHYEPEGNVRGRSDDSRNFFPSPLHQYQSYKGETDPRRLPLVVAPFRAIPLTIDKAQHLTLQDLVVRGGAYDVVDIRHGEHIEFE